MVGRAATLILARIRAVRPLTAWQRAAAPRLAQPVAMAARALAVWVAIKQAAVWAVLPRARMVAAAVALRALRPLAGPAEILAGLGQGITPVAL